MNSSAHDDKGSDGENSLTQEELSARRSQLNRKLKDRQVAEEVELAKSKSTSSGYGEAMKISSEFIAGIVVGACIGWTVDSWFDTMPFGLIVFLMLGFAAGVLNILRPAGYVAGPESKNPSGKSNEGSSGQDG